MQEQTVFIKQHSFDARNIRNIQCERVWKWYKTTWENSWIRTAVFISGHDVGSIPAITIAYARPFEFVDWPRMKQTVNEKPCKLWIMLSYRSHFGFLTFGPFGSKCFQSEWQKLIVWTIALHAVSRGMLLACTMNLTIRRQSCISCFHRYMLRNDFIATEVYKLHVFCRGIKSSAVNKRVKPLFHCSDLRPFYLASEYLPHAWYHLRICEYNGSHNSQPLWCSNTVQGTPADDIHSVRLVSFCELSCD